jgi:hypothetical protein
MKSPDCNAGSALRYCIYEMYISQVRFIWDPKKSERNLAERASILPSPQ